MDAESTFSEVFCRHSCSVTMLECDLTGCSWEFEFSAGYYVRERTEGSFLVSTGSHLKY